METDKQNGQQKAIPVYLSFKTFQSAVQSLRVHGLPDVLDRTAFGSRSGAEQTQILSAFKFLGLIDEKNKTKDALRNLTKAQENSAEEKAHLGTLLRSSYANVFALNLEAATPAQLEKAIGDYGAGGSTKDRCVRFFLKAVEHVGVKVSSRLTARKVRSSSGVPTSEGDAGNGAQTSHRAQRKRKGTPELPPPPNTGSLKTITLLGVNGTLTVSANFNFLSLVGDERKLVFEIIDSMDAFEQTHQVEETDEEKQ